MQIACKAMQHRSCHACLPGTFNNLEGRWFCPRCSAGLFQPLPNATSCINCPQNPVGAISMKTLTTAATNLSACTCMSGYFNENLGLPCRPCKNDMSCASCESPGDPACAETIAPNSKNGFYAMRVGGLTSAKETRRSTGSDEGQTTAACLDHACAPAPLLPCSSVCWLSSSRHAKGCCLTATRCLTQVCVFLQMQGRPHLP